jgi:hypothetical protein
MTLKALSVTELDYLSAASNSLNDKPDVSSKDKYDFFFFFFLAFSLTQLDIGDKSHRYTPISCTAVIDDIINNVLARCELLMADIVSGDLFNLMCNETAKFQFKHRRLVSMGLNSDFWKPIQQQ